MTQTAELFADGHGQAVRLPAAYRFDAGEIFIHRDAETGDVILSQKPDNWDGFFAALHAGTAPDGFLDRRERGQGAQGRRVPGVERSEPPE